MSLITDTFKRGSMGASGNRHGLASGESRDAIGYAIAGLHKLAQNDIIDRLGLRKQTEQLVFTATRNGFKTATAASRQFGKVSRKSGPGTRPAAAGRSGLFDLTPTEDEQMLVDVVTDYATEVLRPAASDANETCVAPAEVLAASPEIGLPILGVPEALGGISEERSAMAGTLVAEALGKGDMGLALAALSPGTVATALGLWGTASQQEAYLPAFTGDDVPVASLALTEPTVLFDVLNPTTTATPLRRRLRPGRREVQRRAWCRLRALHRRRPARRLADAVPWSSRQLRGSPSRPTRRWVSGPRPSPS
ncbi:acyl-CoA dehydrogenase family protein [Nocardioides sp. B-3]|uniref:acyl-CoA dehydrogenase family protein n=1 Tax=Nocardioides sp. B-3 TaxID=2895565 RepID=UPI002152F397|nr:acyl-CoA dehydrogenase family protein [Nocardioides sp. B-3]UUZ59173.1 acyl-CoA dehydrogenase family protein [Nocardioides sp. B-3]